MSTATIAPLTASTVLDRVGGVRGIIDGGLPPLVFVIANTVARVSMDPADAVRLALAGALATGAVIIVVRRRQEQTLVQAMRGLAGLAVAALFAVFSGQARDFFLPGLVVDGAYVVLFAGSVLVGRPLVGGIYRVLSGRPVPWREDTLTRRVFAVATLGWALVYATRAGVQIVLYLEDHPTLLAVSKLALGWPLTALAVVLTLGYLRRTLPNQRPAGESASPESSGRHTPDGPRSSVALAQPPVPRSTHEAGTTHEGSTTMETTELSPLQLSDDARGAVPTTTMASMPAERRPARSQHPSPDGHQRDVVIVGAGQAALATAYYLRQAGVDVQVLERRSTVGASWYRRWDSLRLFTPTRYDALPGLPFPGDPWSYPGKDDVAAYLAQYATRFELPVRTDAEVVALTGRQDAFELHLAGGETITARRVVVATGAFGTPYTPALSGNLGPNVVQVHTDDYRSPATLPVGPVLVVGGGNSGFQVAHELASTGRPVDLAEGARLRTVRQRIAGRDLFWWLTTTRVIHAPAHTRIGRRLRANEPVIGTSRTGLRRAGVVFRPRVVNATPTSVTFEDGTSLAPSAVVWATGYRHDDRWVGLPAALDATGALVTEGADTTIAGLHVIGRPWQRDRGSALLGFVHRDAQRLAERLTAALAGVWVSTC